MSEKQYSEEICPDCEGRGRIQIAGGSAGCILCGRSGYIRRPITSSPEGETKPEYTPWNNPCEACVAILAQEELAKQSSPTTRPEVTDIVYGPTVRELLTEFDYDKDSPKGLKVSEILIRHFGKSTPKPASDWIERAAEEIEDSADRWIDSMKSKEIIAAIITRHMKGEGA